MHPKLQTLLDTRKPGRRGMHGHNQMSVGADYYDRMTGLMIEMGIDWLKLMAGGDNQVETCRRLRDNHSGIIPIIRFYDTSCPANVIAVETVKQYVDAGVLLFESPFNEFYAPYENAWGRPLGKDDLFWVKDVAQGWANFADVVLRAGGVPTTPAIETWKYEDVFVPLFTHLCLYQGYYLDQSAMALHNRPLNHPINYAKDPGGFRGYEWCDAFVWDGGAGLHMPIIGTEAGPEPGWSMDSTYPPVTVQSHATMVRDMLQWKTPPYYLADCFWLIEGDGAFGGASWLRNQQHNGGKDLPAVDMLRLWQIEPPVIPPSPAPDVDAALRKAVAEDLAMYPWGIKYAYAHGLIPWGNEVSEVVDGVTWYAQPAYELSGAKRVLVKFQEGHYTDGETTVIPWEA